ncbi:pyridoxamine 5'-phosphate oxidase family protein [Hymenobacter sp. BT770]|uniref:pyridoxamine 5'-phosphate oxidase family protein n=1 Tax=Hymenobacter sp. BT770 TaxID=2886942 RepID=UPI001D1032C1|nr:pyridoxamine 5'-phosphate oxidase family protein [Hymenobacter sp. BT770]MCC3152572.1 pyridoxamine 5'-phosphate oxidase family protein [Hymenobacter sp. BT770]MDO3414451.1 pyridoxamine 5'-phosphate oxidase family protein [Hymenobacter sp. BT770]
MADQVAVSHDVAKLVEKIKDIKIAMMTTIENGHELHSRPMYTSQPEENGTLWFFTERDSQKVGELEKDRHVNLGYASPSDNLYVAITGTAQVVTDRAKIKELWSEGLRGWFPGGSDDPNIALLKVTIDKGEFWDSPNSTLLRAYTYVKAVVTGERDQPSADRQSVVIPK